MDNPFTNLLALCAFWGGLIVGGLFALQWLGII